MASAIRTTRKLSQLYEKATENHSENLAAAVIESTTTKKELVTLLHATCFYHVKSL